MKTTLALCLLASGIVSAEDNDTIKIDPIVGKWRWFDNRLVEFRVDNRVETLKTTKKDGKLWKGTWTWKPEPVVERKYTIIWADGQLVNEIVLAKDHDSLKGKNTQGNPISAVRVK